MHTHPKVAAVASQNWPFRHDAKCEPLLKFLKANIHEASSHAYPLNLPTRVREDPKFLCCEFFMLIPFVDGGFGCPDGFGHGQFWIGCAWRDDG